MPTEPTAPALRKPQGISFPADLLVQAKEAAKKDSRTLSGYVQKLIQDDLEKHDGCPCSNPASIPEDREIGPEHESLPDQNDRVS